MNPEAHEITFGARQTPTQLDAIGKEPTMTTPKRGADRRRSMPPTWPQLTHTRRRLLGSAGTTVPAGDMDATRPARARTATQSTMTTAVTARSAAQDSAASGVRPFQVEVPQADLDDLRPRIAAMRLPHKELVGDRS